MIVKAGNHEVHLVITEPPALYVRFKGDVSGEEARSIAEIAGQHLRGRTGRILVNVADLGSIAPEGRREFGRFGSELRGCAERACEILFIRARLSHKVVLSQIVSGAACAEARVQTYFFENLDDALALAGLTPQILFGSDLPVPRRRA